MTSKPGAILRFKWKDFPNVQPIWRDNAYTGCFLPIRPTGIARYCFLHQLTCRPG
jgi:hypothetical protein